MGRAEHGPATLISATPRPRRACERVSSTTNYNAGSTQEARLAGRVRRPAPRPKCRSATPSSPSAAVGGVIAELVAAEGESEKRRALAEALTRSSRHEPPGGWWQRHRESAPRDRPHAFAHRPVRATRARGTKATTERAWLRQASSSSRSCRKIAPSAPAGRLVFAAGCSLLRLSPEGQPEHGFRF